MSMVKPDDISLQQQKSQIYFQHKIKLVSLCLFLIALFDLWAAKLGLWKIPWKQTQNPVKKKKNSFFLFLKKKPLAHTQQKSLLGIGVWDNPKSLIDWNALCCPHGPYLFLNGPTPASFSFIFGLFKIKTTIFSKKIMSVQYTVLGFEPTTSRIWVVSHYH